MPLKLVDNFITPLLEYTKNFYFYCFISPHLHTFRRKNKIVRNVKIMYYTLFIRLIIVISKDRNQPNSGETMEMASTVFHVYIRNMYYLGYNN